MAGPIYGLRELREEREYMSENKKSQYKTLKARSCYGHLGGTLGERLFEQLLLLGWFERDDSKTTVYVITPLGKKNLTELGVNIYEMR